MEKNSKLKQQARKYTETFSCLEFDCNKGNWYWFRLLNLPHRWIFSSFQKQSPTEKPQKLNSQNNSKCLNETLNRKEAQKNVVYLLWKIFEIRTF